MSRVRFTTGEFLSLRQSLLNGGHFGMGDKCCFFTYAASWRVNVHTGNEASLVPVHIGLQYELL